MQNKSDLMRYDRRNVKRGKSPSALAEVYISYQRAHVYIYIYIVVTESDTKWFQFRSIVIN